MCDVSNGVGVSRETSLWRFSLTKLSCETSLNTKLTCVAFELVFFQHSSTIFTSYPVQVFGFEKFSSRECRSIIRKYVENHHNNQYNFDVFGLHDVHVYKYYYSYKKERNERKDKISNGSLVPEIRFLV